MRNFTPLLTFVVLMLLPSSSALSQTSSIPSQIENKSETFTGKISRNKVRLRLQPSLEGTIIRELNRGELLLVTGETDEFYIVRPPQDIKAYVFRTFILDGIVEGKHINVRLSPDLEAPVISQLNDGDKVNGVISPLNSKWLEIEPPANAKFYVCKEFIDRIGGPTKLAEMNKRAQEVHALFENTEELSRKELQKPYEEIQIEIVYSNLNKIIQHYVDFPDQVMKAKELLNFVRDSFLQKKIAFLETKAQVSQKKLQPSSPTIQSLSIVQSLPPEPSPEPIDAKIAAWLPIEKKYYEAWAKEKGGSLNDFYQKEKNEAVILTGIVEPYIRHLRNKPGDYILVSGTTKLPNAYLYSTKVDLSSKIGQTVSLVASPRPNNNFAYPAYFIHSLD